MMLGQKFATALLLQRWVNNPKVDNDFNIKDTKKLYMLAI